MTDDAILNATLASILEKKEHLGLAFWIEKAMPYVREKLFRKVLDGIEQYFQRKGRKVIGPGGKTMEKNAGLTLFPKDWSERADKTGIRLETGSGNWNSVYVGVYLSQEVITSELLQELESLGARKSEKNWPIWEYMRDGLKDWREMRFLEGAHSKTEDIVKELTELLENYEERPEVRKILKAVKQAL